MKNDDSKKFLMNILNRNTDMTDSSKKEAMVNDKPFSYAYGNPPYQQVITQGNNSSKNVTNVFQNFQKITNIISDNSTLIYPGGRWLNKTGKNMNQLHDTLLTDKHTESIITYPKSEVLFPSCIIVDGISIVNRNMNNIHDTIRMIDGNDMNTVYRINANTSNTNILLSVNVKTNIIIDKIKKSETSNNDDNQAFKVLNHYSRAYFNIESDYVSKHDCEPCSSNSPMKHGYVKALTNDFAGVTGRAGWFYVNENDITDKMNVINDYKIVVASFAINGIHGGSMHTEIINPGSVCGRSRLMIYTTSSKKTADLFMKWFETDIIRFTWASTGMGAGAVGSNTPDFNDFLTSSGIKIDEIDTVQSINNKLTEYYKLTDDEIDYIHDYVSTLDRFN